MIAMLRLIADDIRYWLFTLRLRAKHAVPDKAETWAVLRATYNTIQSAHAIAQSSRAEEVP
jgi:hypothetical protein